MAKTEIYSIYIGKAERQLQLAREAATLKKRIAHLNRASVYATKCELSRRVVNETA